ACRCAGHLEGRARHSCRAGGVDGPLPRSLAGRSHAVPQRRPRAFRRRQVTTAQRRRDASRQPRPGALEQTWHGPRRLAGFPSRARRPGRHADHGQGRSAGRLQFRLRGPALRAHRGLPMKHRLTVGAHPVRDRLSTKSWIAHRVRSYGIASIIVLATCLQIAQADEPPPQLSPAKTAAQANLVDIRSLVPDIAEDIKYAGSDNFVGRPVHGYLAPKCLLLRPAAEALARVERELRTQHYRLKLWDCYRP